MVELSGIYKIICLINNKFYIGGSVNTDKRLKGHIRSLKQNKHENRYLQNFWNKYGEENFKFEIIETIYDISKLSIREKWWLDTTKCYNRKIGFNISRDPQGLNGIKGFIDLTGQKFNRLTVVEYVGQDKNGNRLWLCLCDCGNEKIVLGASLKTGNTKSCGCLYKGNKNALRHGYSTKGEQSKAYNTWSHLLERCNNPKSSNYKNYGGRIPPITVCRRWRESNGREFLNFLEDMGEPPTNKHQIDRTDNNLGYYKNNCRWVLSKINNRNKRNNRLIPYNDQIYCLSSLAELHNIRRDTLAYRLDKMKMSLEDALTTPVKNIKRINK